MRCSAYDGCQVGAGGPPGFWEWSSGVGPAQRSDSGVESGARAVGCRPSLVPRLRLHGPFRVPFLKASGLSFLLFAGGVLPGVRRAGLADRCRRFRMCRTMSSYTSSYPDRCAETHRPLCRACLMTAATGGSAPSNPRVNAGFTSCSYELEPPGRKGFCALFSGSGWRQNGVGEG